MRVLIDFNNIIYASFFMEIKNNALQETGGNEYLLRHMFYTKLLALKREFHAKPADMYICMDHKVNWRKRHFEYYKASRAKKREESEIDFQFLFDLMDSMESEMKTSLPFNVLREEGLEADDWIAILSETDQPVIVVSTDKDFYQLLTKPNVKIYNHVKLETVTLSKPPHVEKWVKILNGDTGDGIPNVFSDSDTFICEEKRQKAFGERKAEMLLNEVAPMLIFPEPILKEHFKKLGLLENFNRNNLLINFDEIPDEIRKKANDTIQMLKPSMNQVRMLAYLTQKNLVQLSSRVHEFFN